VKSGIIGSLISFQNGTLDNEPGGLVLARLLVKFAVLEIAEAINDEASDELETDRLTILS
jgi:hypothetical protein